MNSMDKLVEHAHTLACSMKVKVEQGELFMSHGSHSIVEIPKLKTEEDYVSLLHELGHQYDREREPITPGNRTRGCKCKPHKEIYWKMTLVSEYKAWMFAKREVIKAGFTWTPVMESTFRKNFGSYMIGSIKDGVSLPLGRSELLDERELYG